MSKWISIDLGTSNCSAAIWNGRHAEMVEFHDSRFPAGVSHQMPSAVYVDPDTMEIHVGVDALQKGKAHRGEWLYRFWKRRLGEAYHDAAESGHQTRADEATGLVAYKGPKGRVIPTVDLAAWQIDEILTQATEKLGERPVNAVITIPADAGEAQKAATLEAARKAGLSGRIELEHEPTMAALAFGYDFSKRRVIAVVDHGAGTLDVSFIETGKGKNNHSLVEVLVTDGRRKGLGGMDFDRATTRYLVNRFRTINPDADISADPFAMDRVTDAGEEAKRALSGKEEAHVYISDIARTGEGVSLAMDETLDMKTFTAITGELTKQIEAICRRAAEKVKEKDKRFLLSDVQDVILVGGMTRSPVVRAAVRNVFAKEPRREINPEEAVSLGGAIKTAILSGALNGVTVRDIITHAIGIETTDGIVSNVFAAGTSYPTSREITIRNADDGQEALSLAVTEGASIYENECTILATHDHIVSEPGPARKNGLKLSCKIDESGVASITAEDGWQWSGAS